MIGSFYLHRRTSKTKKQSAPRALTNARRQFGVRSDVQARLELGLAAPNIDGLRPAQVKPIINLSKAFSCFAGVAQRHDHLSEEKKQQVIALGMEKFTGVRRETAGAYLKAAGIGVRAPGGWGRRAPAKPANEVTTDSSESKPANEVTTDFGPPISLPTGNRDRVSSACEPYRELLEQGLGRGRNAMAIWQDLVSDHGFPHGYQTVKRFVHKLRGSTQPQAVGIIHTAAGEEAQADYGSGPM
ncbi:MAG: hypothetical protein DMG34_20770, partial [Acidobacteria bacterium]